MIAVVWGFAFQLSASTEHSIYKKYFPYFAMPCAVSQFTPLDNVGVGNPYGHGVIFLEGACLKPNEEFPVLTTECSEENREVGVSADAAYRNVNATAVPGYELFFHGNLKPDQVLNMNEYNRVVEEALQTGAFRGVRPQTDPKAPPQGWRLADEIEKSITQGAVGTDFALNFGRNLYCQRIPVNAHMMELMVAYINKMNSHYRNSEDGFRLSFPKNNCTHLVHNTLAAAGVWDFKKTDSKDPIGELANIAIPGNEIAHAIDLTNGSKLPTVDDFYWNDRLGALLMKENFVLVQAGDLFDFTRIHGLNQDGTANGLNQMYRTESDLKVVNVPAFEPAAETLKKAGETATYNSLYDHLLWYEGRYLKAWKDLPGKRKRDWMAHFKHFPFRKYEYENLYTAYKSYLEAKLVEVEAILSSMELENESGGRTHEVLWPIARSAAP